MYMRMDWVEASTMHSESYYSESHQETLLSSTQLIEIPLINLQESEPFQDIQISQNTSYQRDSM